MTTELAGSQRDARDAAVFDLSILGEFRLTDGRTGTDCTPKSRKARALLAYLALTGAGPTRREGLATLLWGDRPEEQARTNLRQTLFELRDLSAEPASLLTAGRDSLALNRSLFRSDAEAIRAIARAGDIAGLQSALGRWQGGLLSDLDSISPEFDEWLAGTRAREHEATIGAAMDAAAAALDAGDARAAAIVALLQTIDSTNERVLRLGLLADARAGDSAGLHRRYRAFVETLRRELDAAPSAETQRLFRSLVPPDEERNDPPPTRPAPRTEAPVRVRTPAETVRGPPAIGAGADRRIRPSYIWWGLAGTFAAALVAAALIFLPSGGQPPPTATASSKPAIDPVAYELYRRGVEAMRQRTPLATVQAEALLENAVSRAPHFSRAWSALAFAQIGLAHGAASGGKSPQEVARWFRVARESANRAIALDPRNGEPYMVLAEFVMSPDMDSERLTIIEKGLSIEPNNVDLIRSHGLALFSDGLAEDALDDFRRAHRLDPLDPRTIAALYDSLVDSGHVSEAREVLDKGLAIYPLYIHLWRQKLVALLSDGEFDAADAMLAPTAARPAPQWEHYTPGLRLIVRALRTGRPADVEVAMAPLRREARAATTEDVHWLVWKMALLGRLDDAFSVVRARDTFASRFGPLPPAGAWPTAEEEASSRDVFYHYDMFVDVIFAPFRRDPRFVETWAPTNIRFWQKTGRWPTFCRDPRLQYDCKVAMAKR